MRIVGSGAEAEEGSEHTPSGEGGRGRGRWRGDGVRLPAATNGLHVMMQNTDRCTHVEDETRERRSTRRKLKLGA